MTPRGATLPACRTAETDAGRRGVSPAVLRVLVANHSRFLAFLQRRVGRRDVAEEILQDAFVRGLSRGGALRADESAVAWFYRLLRNALVDRHRRAAAEARGLATLGDEPRAGGNMETDEELVETICACVTSLVETLKRNTRRRSGASSSPARA